MDECQTLSDVRPAGSCRRDAVRVASMAFLRCGRGRGFQHSVPDPYMTTVLRHRATPVAPNDEHARR
jgi:hypothetical protein